MSKISRDAANAFMRNESFQRGNTKVWLDSSGYIRMYLHHNLIAKCFYSGEGLEISNSHWFSKTSKSRLNALEGAHIQQKKGIWYLNGKEWDSKWIKI